MDGERRWWLSPPKAEATRSNRVGCTSFLTMFGAMWFFFFFTSLRKRISLNLIISIM